MVFRRFGLTALLATAAAVLIAVMRVVAQHTIDVVRARQLLPRWDLATHLDHGWTDYHLLVTGEIPRFVADLWFQGYWPPALSLYQIPFYIVLGSGMTSGLWSTIVAFVLTGVIGCAIAVRERPGAQALAASAFLALLISSPYLLAYATVTMTEIPGACVQMIVLFCYSRYRQHPNPSTARAFAISLTILFFTKYNYFLMLAAPLLIYEWLEHTAGWSASQRVRAVGRWTGRVLSSPVGAFVVIYLLAIVIIARTGGFEFHFLGERWSVRGSGNSGLVVLYVLLGRLWYRYARGRFDWARLTSADVRVRPLLRWFVLPVTIWLASPYPNHLRDFANLVINAPMGDTTLAAGMTSYLDVLRGSYFYNGWILAFVAGVFIIGAFAYRQQPPVTQLLIVAVPLQFAAIALHQTRFPRFLLLTVVLLCLAAASEVARWFTGSHALRRIAVMLAPIVLVSGLWASANVRGQDRFRAIAFEHYTDSPALGQAFGSIRSTLAADDRLAIIGHSDELSPALFRWQLGPPSGVSCVPFETVGSRRIELSQATRVLLVVPLGSDDGRLEDLQLYEPSRRALEEGVARGEFMLARHIAVPDMQVAFELYARTLPPERKPPCL